MTATEITGPPVTAPAVAGRGPRTLPRWPLILIAAPAAVAVWSGWVGLGLMCGFGVVHPLPGIVNGFSINTAITLPVGVEAYGAYAMGAWLHPGTPASVRKFARNSALGSLALGMGGQVIYHLLTAWGIRIAPWPVVTFVSCLPVLTLGFGAALTHLLRAGHVPPAVEAEAAPAAATAPDTAPATVADSTPDTPADTAQDIHRHRSGHPPGHAAARRRPPAWPRCGTSTRTCPRPTSRPA